MKAAQEGCDMAKEANWIGHSSAQRRKRRDGTYEYLDPQNQSIAIMLGVSAFHPESALFAGANLWEVDGFVERMETIAAPDAEMFREALNKIRERFKKDDLCGNIHESEAWDSLRAHAAIINVGMRACQNDDISILAPASEHARKSNGRKLTEAQRDEIVQRARQGETHRKLGDEFGVSHQYVSTLCAKYAPKKVASPFPGAATKQR
ncbi:hypothetical protein [Burkholderia sp. LAS2]|uniref:hypothetical protein n=1 Tax=Burkholderia sp. LAS2 TaxID=2813843 RepID=UPI001BD16C5B|nr:hypothetical protein [Burkholderia sp. LAS2]QVN10289.1 hypothetical protein JYG37_13175 [Burkholderia sp. LAS2]